MIFPSKMDPETVTNWPKTTPRGPKRAPRRRQDGLKTAQDVTKTAHDGPKTSDGSCSENHGFYNDLTDIEEKQTMISDMFS